MEEMQIWQLLATQIIGFSIFLAGNAFLIWVAFRVSKSVNETGGNIIFKLVGTVFGLGIIWNGLIVQGFVGNVVQSASYSLGQLKESGGEVSALAESFMSANGTDLPEFSIVPDVIGIIWWISVLAIILLPMWGPKASD